MKAIKSVLAASVLVIAGTANSATQTYTVTSAPITPAIYRTLNSDGDPISINLPVWGSGIGNAWLSDSGVLTMDVLVRTVLDISAAYRQPAGTFFSDAITRSIITLNTTGEYNLSKSGSKQSIFACYNGPFDGTPDRGKTCDYVELNSLNNGLYGLSSFFSSQSFNLSGGTINLVSPSSLLLGIFTTTSYTLQAVPVPAAAWLFSSALLTLVGTGRRRKMRSSL